MLDYYNCKDFIMYDDWRDYIKYQETNTCIMSNILELLGVDRDNNIEQHIKHFTIYPRSFAYHTRPFVNCHIAATASKVKTISDFFDCILKISCSS